MTTWIVGLLVVASVVWCVAIALCWLWWARLGQRLGGYLTPTGYSSILTMPIWTVHILYEFRWLPKRRLRKLRELLATAPPDAPAHAIAKLRAAIQQLELELEQRKQPHG